MNLDQTKGNNLIQRAYQLAMVAFFLILSSLSLNSYAQNVTDHDVKAVFLYNFANFVSWPKEAFQQPSTSFNFCTMGKSQVNKSLAAVIKDETVKGRPLRLFELDITADFSHCHILFINASEQVYSPGILEETIGKNTFTVGDSKDFTSSGGMVSLVYKKRRIHPIINMDVISQGRLKISSKLLRLTTLVKASQKEEDKQ